MFVVKDEELESMDFFVQFLFLELVFFMLFFVGIKVFFFLQMLGFDLLILESILSVIVIEIEILDKFVFEGEILFSCG